MKHHILVKWNDTVTDKAENLVSVRALFAPAVQQKGIEKVDVFENCIARDNRYDVMIVITMAKEALALWDNSDIHKTWKSRYGERIEKKAIFDCE